MTHVSRCSPLPCHMCETSHAMLAWTKHLLQGGQKGGRAAGRMNNLEYPSWLVHKRTGLPRHCSGRFSARAFSSTFGLFISPQHSYHFSKLCWLSALRARPSIFISALLRLGPSPTIA